MRSRKIKAVFIGENGSLGYETNKEYTLTISGAPLPNLIKIEPKTKKCKPCEYGGIISFISNWDNIRNV